MSFTGKMTKEEKNRLRLHAIENLKRILPPVSTVYGVVTPSKSGMSSNIKVLAVDDGRIRDIGGFVSNATGMTWKDNGTIVVKGSGFNRIQHVADALSHSLYGEKPLLKYESL